MTTLSFVRSVRALVSAAVAAACLVVSVAGAAAYVTVRMPMSNETLCDLELHVEGAVIEPSRYEPTGLGYFPCSIKFRDVESPRNKSSRWVIRVDRMVIPYDKRDLSGRPPTIKFLDYAQELAVFQYPVNASVTKQKFIAHYLSVNFINIPKDSDYRLVITLDTGDSNCTENHKCVVSQYCISTDLRCNHVDNCGDGSDESKELCPPPAETKTTIVVASFSVGLIIIIALIVIMIVFCRSKISRRKRGVNRGITYIRPPPKNDVPRVLPLTDSSKDARMRRVGPGFQAAPLAMKNSPSSTSGSLPRLVALKQSQNSAPSTPKDDRYVHRDSTAATADGCTDAAAALLHTDQLASYHRRSTHDPAAAVDSDTAAPPAAASAELRPRTSEVPLLPALVDARDAAQPPVSSSE